MADGPDGQPIAIVGLACRFPDADDPPALLDMVLTGRRAFRRLPPCRLDLADYYSADPATPDATYSSRAALIEGWQFDQAAFGIAGPAYLAADPAQWLALETAARALAGAGFPGGAGLPRDRVGVIVGNTLTGDYSRAGALRLRWPYVRRVLAEALVATDIPAAQATQVLCDAAARYLAPFPAAGSGTLAGGIPAAIASGICGYFGFRGGSLAVDGAGASSLLAVASACSALTSGDLDVALAGGVDLSLDPLELVGLAKTGVLAAGEVRVYDQNPTGFLPGEGCGVVVLMRARDARAASLPVYAEIVGWGSSAASADSAGQLLALRRAYERAGVDPADVQLIEGNGDGTAAGDAAELSALATLRAGAGDTAALGSVKANIGHAKAAAGAAALIKTVLALGTGIIPPATGVSTPHFMLRGGGAALRLPRSPQRWPEGTRLAGVSAMSPGGLCAHLVLRHEHARTARHDRTLAAAPLAASPGPGPSPGPAAPASRAVGGPPRPVAYLLHATDRRGLAAAARRLADVAPWLSDSELQDLGCHLARAASAPGPARIAIVASRQDQLAQLASEALALLPQLAAGLLAERPGIFAADGADGRVTLLMSDQEMQRQYRQNGIVGQHAAPAAGSRPEAIRAYLAAFRWLGEHGVQAGAAVGHGLGDIAGLAWAGCLSEFDAVSLAAVRAEILTACAAGGAEPEEVSGRLRDAAARFRFSPPRRRLISAGTGRELASASAITDLLCAAPGPASRLGEAVAAGAAGACLLVETGPGRTLLAAAAGIGGIPAVRIVTGQDDGGRPGSEAARAAAALFAAGALTDTEPLFAGLPARPMDIWRERTFITSPCRPGPARQGDGELTGPQAPAAAGPDPWQSEPTPAEKPAPAEEPATAEKPAAEGPDSWHGEPAAAAQVRGVSTWARCYIEDLRPPQRPVLPADDRPWRLRAAGNEQFGALAGDLFRHDPDADRTLAIIGGQAGPGTCAAALGAARDAIGTGRLVVITDGSAMAGFWAALHAEHPSLGITVLRAPPGAEGLRAARGFAAAEPGEFRELVVDAAGLAREVTMVPATLRGGGAVPLAPGDVLLLGTDSGSAGLALAQVLSCCGTAVAMIGQGGKDEDGKIVAGLEELRHAGARVAFEAADVADTAGRAAALRRIERRLGPITAIGHAVGDCESGPITALTQAELGRQLAAAGLTRLASGIETSRLALIVTFGSVAARYGLAGHGLLALASASLAGQAETLAGSIPGCRALHVDWAGWAGADLPRQPGSGGAEDPAGVMPLDVGAASRLLLKALAAPGLPARLAVHGRVGPRAPRPVRAAEAARARPAAGRFTEVTLVHYPGVEFICEASLSLRSDPYLADYRVDGMPVLPPTMALEAMAQAASVLAGRPLRRATAVSMAVPVVIPAGRADSQALIRICALRDSGTVQVVLRCEESSFGVDHFRAEFCCDGEASRSAGRWPAAASSGLDELTASATGIVDGAELYGPICFQSGRFRRVAILPEVTSRSCKALARGADDLPWFGSDGGGSSSSSSSSSSSAPEEALILGSPGLSDATLHALQACVPHRRLLPAGCESVTFSGRAAVGAVEIRAVAVPAVPRQAGGSGAPMALRPPPEQLWDVEAVDATGRPLLTWRRLRFTDAGPLPRNAAWPPSLLSIYLESSLAALGLDPGLRIAVKCGRPDAIPPQQSLALAGPGLPQTGSGRPAQRAWRSCTVAGSAQLDGLTLRARAAVPVACSWAAAEPGLGAAPDTGQGLAQAGAQIRHRLAEPPGTIAARLRAVADCLASPQAPAGCRVAVSEMTSDGWVLLGVPGARLACAVVEISGVSCPVAIAVMTGTPSQDAGPPGRPRPAGRNRSPRAAARP